MDIYNISFFKEYIHKLKLSGKAKTMSDIAEKCNIKGGQSRLSQVINGHVPFTKEFADNVYNVYPVNEIIQSEKYESEGKIINPKDYPEKSVYVVPIKGRGGLYNAYYDELALDDLEIEQLSIKFPSSKGSTWFKIEVEGVSMDDSTADFEGSKYSLCEGDWAYCRSIPKIYWKSKLHFNSVKIFCFFHNIRGIIFKKVIEHNPETGELTLHSLNKDKERFPDFKINIAECSYICNVLKVITEFN